MNWLYGQAAGLFGTLFEFMGGMGAELFEQSAVQGIVLFFQYLGWALFVVGLVVSGFEFGIERQSGRGSVKDVLLNALKGFLAVSLFTAAPLELFKLAVTLQGSMTRGLTHFLNFDSLLAGITDAFANFELRFSGVGTPIMLFVTIMLGYAVIKVFLGNLKRGGILLVQMAVGSLYMFSVPRGYIDGFVQWMKQVIGLCLTTFLQSVFLAAGLYILYQHPILGLGLMLAAGEVPRVAGAFGLDSTTKANIAGAVNTVQSAVRTTQIIAQAVAK